MRRNACDVTDSRVTHRGTLIAPMRSLRSLLTLWRGLDVPTQTPLGETWADLLVLVPRRAQRRAIELVLIIQGSHAAHIADAEQDGYARGLESGRVAVTPTADEGFKAGFEKGWDRATLDVLSRTGVPAGVPVDEDDTSIPLPPC